MTRTLPRPTTTLALLLPLLAAGCAAGAASEAAYVPPRPPPPLSDDVRGGADEPEPSAPPTSTSVEPVAPAAPAAVAAQPVPEPGSQPGASEPVGVASHMGDGARPQAAADAATTEAASATTKAAASEPDDVAVSGLLEASLGTVAGRPLLVRELLADWHQLSPGELWGIVDNLITTHFARADAGRLGLRLNPELVEAQCAEQREKFEEQVAKLEPNLSIDEFVRSKLGMEPELYFDRLREGVIRGMLVERAVRAWTLSNETAAVRICVVKGEDKVVEVMDLVAGGADFAALVEEYGVEDPGAGEGGLVPFVVKQEYSPLARVVFATPVGRVGGPVELDEHRLLVKVESFSEPLEGSWSVVGEAVESSLAEHEIGDAEFMHWKLIMEKRYSLDLTPLFQLVGPPPG